MLDLRCAIGYSFMIDPVSVGTTKGKGEDIQPIGYERENIERYFRSRSGYGPAVCLQTNTRVYRKDIQAERSITLRTARFVAKYKDITLKGPTWDLVREECTQYLEAIEENPDLLQIQNDAEREEREERERVERLQREEQERLQREEQERLQREDPDRYRLLCTLQEAPPRAMLIMSNDDEHDIALSFLKCEELNGIGDKCLTLLENLEPLCPIMSLGYAETESILSAYPNISEIVMRRFNNIWRRADKKIISEQKAYEENKLLLDNVEKDYWKRRKDLSYIERELIERLRERRILLEYPDIEDMVSCFKDLITGKAKKRQLKLSDNSCEIFLDRLNILKWFENQPNSQKLQMFEKIYYVKN